MIEAYVLRTIDYQEHGKLLYLYTEEGMLSCIARGVKKMNSPYRHLAQSGMHIQCDLSKGKLPTLKDAQMHTYYQHIKQDLIKSTVLSVINELIYYNVSKADDHPKLMQFLRKWLKALNETTAPIELLMVFELKFLYFLGYGMRFQTCNYCKKDAPLFLDTHTGMVVCDTHREQGDHYIDEQTFEPLRYFLHVDIHHFEPQSLNKVTTLTLIRVIESLYETHLSSTPKAKKILKTLL